MDSSIKNLCNKMNEIMVELGFEQLTINDLKFFKRKNNFYTISYIEEIMSFVIEYTEGIEEVKKNRLLDADLYPIKMGEKELLKEFRSDIINYYLR